MMVPTYQVTIWMAGDYSTAQRVLRDWAYKEGACWTITPTKFIYTGGEEDGFTIGCVNYPRFPRYSSEIDRIARDLSRELLKACNQRTCLLVGTALTEWVVIEPPGSTTPSGHTPL